MRCYGAIAHCYSTVLSGGHGGHVLPDLHMGQRQAAAVARTAPSSAGLDGTTERGVMGGVGGLQPTQN